MEDYAKNLVKHPQFKSGSFKPISNQPGGLLRNSYAFFDG